VARELRSGRLVRLWLADGAPAAPPYDVGPDSIFTAFYSSAELGCHLALDWPFPARVLDLFCEFRCLTSGLSVPCGHSLLGALAYYGLDAIGAAEKKEMRELAMRGPPYSDAERQALLNYCQEDTDALARLLPVMLPHLDVPRALLRGRYMAAAARVEWVGTPIDTDLLQRLRDNWDRVKSRLISAIDRDYNVYDGCTFKRDRWEGYLAARGIGWPRLESGVLDLRDDTFREMSRAFPKEVAPIRELRHTLSQLRLNELTVGADGRNRCLLSAFLSSTGRNQPSNSKFIFGPSTWLRSLIRPEPGMAVAYCDWSAQELGIAASLSGDLKMQEAYRSGDAYMWLARHVAAVPPGATQKTHGQVREQFKIVSLGVLYGLSAEGLARRLNVSPCRGWELLRYHQQTFPTFWTWSDRVEAEAMLTGRLRTVFGWTVHVGQNVNPRSLRNSPMQANGAEMMRLACCLLTEEGIEVCAPVHDALLVTGPIDQIKAIAARTHRAMRRASEYVLPGFALRSKVKIVKHPDRYSDKRGRAMWETVQRLLKDEEEESCGVTNVLQAV
jgi:hypothetical protein